MKGRIRAAIRGERMKYSACSSANGEGTESLPRAVDDDERGYGIKEEDETEFGGCK